jgi:hypothetical protein
MTRPLYETDQDRQLEADVGKTLSVLWGCSLIRMKRACVIDYAIKRSGEIVAVMEIKCRTYTYEKLHSMGGLILSAHKMQSAKAWRDTHNVAFVLALGLPDGVYTFSIKTEDEWPFFPLIIAGRHDRGDAQDIEPCVVIPMERFVRNA